MSIRVRRPLQRSLPARGRKWKESAVLALLILASAIVQGSLPAIRGLGNFRPDLVLIVVVYWALKRGAGAAWFVGLLGGGLSDLFSAGLFGLGAVSQGLAAVAVVLSSRPLYREHLSSKVVMVILAALVNSLVYYLLLVIFSTPPPWAAVWRGAIWPHLWQTALVSPLWLWLAEKTVGGKQ